MEYFFNQIDEIKLEKGMEESPLLEQQFLKKVRHQGRTYSLYGVYARKLGTQEKMLTFFECLAKSLLSCGIPWDPFSFIDFRDKWNSVFAEKHIRAVYLPFEEDEEKIQNPDLTLKVENGILVVYFPVVGNGQITQGLNLDPRAVVEEKTGLRGFFARSAIDEGFNPLLFNSEERNLMMIFVQRWFEREDSLKPSWTIEELAVLLGIEKGDLEEWCYRLQLFNGPHLPLDSDALNWLFNSIKKSIENKLRATMQWGVKIIWNPRMEVLGKENRFPNGDERSSWKLDELSMFLAVKKEAFARFLKFKKVSLNEEESYSSQGISDALRTATNSEINTMLESERTQTKSLRFAAN